MTNHSFTRRSFLKTLGASTLTGALCHAGLWAQSSNSVLRHASFGASGQALSDLREIAKFKQVRLVAVAEVDLNRTVELKKQFPDVIVYQNWRQLLDKEAKNIDSVNVSIPDHMHAINGHERYAIGQTRLWRETVGARSLRSAQA